MKDTHEYRSTLREFYGLVDEWNPTWDEFVEYHRAVGVAMADVLNKYVAAIVELNGPKYTIPVIHHELPRRRCATTILSP